MFWLSGQVSPVQMCTDWFWRSCQILFSLSSSSVQFLIERDQMSTTLKLLLYLVTFKIPLAKIQLFSLLG